MRTRFFFIFYVVLEVKVILASTEETRLVSDLMDHGYKKNVRPVLNHNSPVYVDMGLVLNQIVKLDERNQIMENSVWLRFFWTDVQLTWNKSSYGDIQQVSLSANQIWKPDISLYNNAGNTFFLGDDEHANVLVNSSGYVQWLTPAMTVSSCMIDVTYFPFDEQRCKLTFGSWIFNGDQLFLKNATEKGDTTFFVDNGEWQLIDIPLHHKVKYYACCNEPFTDITYVLVIRRRPLAYIYNLVLPVMLISLIGIMGFYLPPDSGEKVSLGVTVLLAMTVFMLIIAESMPPTSEVVPLIGKYFGATIILLSLSTLMTVVVMNIHSRGATGKSVPSWLKSVTKALANIFCMNLVFDATTKTQMKNEGELLNGNEDFGLHSLDPLLRMHTRSEMNRQFNKKSSYTEHVLGELRVFIQECREKSLTEEVTDRRITEWKYVALVADRLLLITFLLITIIVSVAILTQSQV